MSSNRGDVAIKIDLEKAYDQLEWSFIRDTLYIYNFSTHSIKLILGCVCLASITVIINGELSDFFHHSRGTQQGDPLSQYILILYTEFLSLLIEKEVSKGNWKAIKVGRVGPKISHSLFADDIILFGEDEDYTIATMQEVL